MTRAGRQAVPRRPGDARPRAAADGDRPADRRQHRRARRQHGEDGRRPGSAGEEGLPLLRRDAADAQHARHQAAAPDRHADAGERRAQHRQAARRLPGLADADRPAHRQGRRQGARPGDGRLGEPRAAALLSRQPDLAQGRHDHGLHQLLPGEHQDRRPGRSGVPGAPARRRRHQRGDPRLRRRQGAGRQPALQGSAADRRPGRPAGAERPLHHQLAARQEGRGARRLRQAGRPRASSSSACR